MTDADQKPFATMLTVILDVYNRSASAETVEVFWRALRSYDLLEVRKGFDGHLRDPERGRYPPMPADIIAQIPTGHPEPNEAWAMVQHALGDQGATIVLTEPMRTAFFVADAISDDKIQARMAFLDVYRREVRLAPPPRWGIIAGWDMQRRQDAIAAAVEAGRLRIEVARQYLPEPMTSLPQHIAQPAKPMLQRII